MSSLIRRTFFITVVLLQLSSSLQKSGELIVNYMKPTEDTVLVTCAYCGAADVRAPRLTVGNVSAGTSAHDADVARQHNPADDCYLVNMQLLLVDALLPDQAQFECQLQPTSGDRTLQKTLDYSPNTGSIVAAGPWTSTGCLVTGLLTFYRFLH